MTWHWFFVGLLPLIIGYRTMRKKQIMRNNLQFWRNGNLQIHFPSMLARICLTRNGASLPERVKSLRHNEMMHVEYYFIRRTTDGKWEGRLSQEAWNNRQQYAQLLYDDEKDRCEADKTAGIYPQIERLKDDLATFSNETIIKRHIDWHPLEYDYFPVPPIETAYQKFVHTPDVHPISFYWHEYNENWFLENFYFNKKKDAWYKNIIFFYISRKITSHNQQGNLYQIILS